MTYGGMVPLVEARLHYLAETWSRDRRNECGENFRRRLLHIMLIVRASGNFPIDIRANTSNSLRS